MRVLHQPGETPLPPGIPDPRARELALYGGGDYELIFTLPRNGPRTWRALQSDRESHTGEGGACGGKPVEKQGTGTGGREPAPRQVPAHFS